MRLVLVSVLVIGACGCDGQGTPPEGPACVLSLSVNGRHSCAVRGDGGVYCWGDRSFGQVGDGSLGGLVACPARVPLPAAATEVVAGQFHTCAIAGDRRVYCWGASGWGELGDGSTEGQACVDPLGEIDDSFCRPSPVQVTGLTDAVELAAGHGFSCARRGDGTVWCWGQNNLGQLGDGTTTGDVCLASVCRPAPGQVGGVAGAVEIAAGAAHACARIGDGTLRCWGFNLHGQLGNGSSGNSNPTAALVAALGDTAMAVAAGQHHTCATKEDGSLWCFGSNEWGQIGDAVPAGAGNRATSPIQVTALGTAVAAVGAGQSTTCAVLAGGEVRCFGSAGGGVLGNDATGAHPEPVAVALGGAATAVGGGYFHVCALLADGHSRCWGWNEQGQIGTGSVAAARTRPTEPSLTCP